MNIQPVLAVAALAVVATAIALRPWLASRRFGPSRLLGDRPNARPGEVVTAILEGPERLGCAREVLFELVEKNRSSVGPGGFREKVQATAVVTIAAFQLAPGVTRVPVSLTVPADGQPSFSRTGIGLSLAVPFLIGTRVTERVWEIRASADVGGRPYRVAFPVPVVGPDGV